jgi:hypothetical protein
MGWLLGFCISIFIILSYIKLDDLHDELKLINKKMDEIKEKV